MGYIGKIHVKVNDTDYLAKITDEGVAFLPNGEEKKLTAEQFAVVKEKLEEAMDELASTKSLTMPPEKETAEANIEEMERDKSSDSVVVDEVAETGKTAEHKTLASEITGRYEENYKRQKKEKGNRSTVLAIVFAVLFILETTLAGVGYAMGYVSINIPGITSSNADDHIETTDDAVTNIQPIQ